MVGTVLFGINHLDVVVRGDADTTVWIKSAVTHLVPFCVSCAGVLAGTRLQQQPRQKMSLSSPSANEPRRSLWPVQWRSTNIRGSSNFGHSPVSVAVQSGDGGSTHR